MNYKLGQRIVGAVLRTQRHRLQLRTKDIAHRVHLEAVNLISYIEKGTAGVASSRVSDFARAYEFDETEFALFWSVMRLLDEKIPPPVLRDIIVRSTLWEGRDEPPHGGLGPDSRPPRGPDNQSPQHGPLSPLHHAARQILTYIGNVPPDDDPVASVIQNEVLITSSMSTCGLANQWNFRLFLCVLAAIFLAAGRHEHYTWQLCIQT